MVFFKKIFYLRVFPSTPRMLVQQPAEDLSLEAWNENKKFLLQIKQNFSSECCSGQLEHRINTPAVYFLCSDPKFSENLKIFFKSTTFSSTCSIGDEECYLDNAANSFLKIPGMSFLKCEHLIKSRKFLQK